MLTLPPHSSPRFDIARASYGGSAVVHGLLTPWRENEAESVAAPSSIAVVFTWPARAWIRKGSGRAFRWQVRPGDVGLGGVQPMRWIETDNPSDFVEVAAPLELRQSVAAEFRVPQHADLVDVHGFTDPVLVAIGMRLRSALRGAAPVAPCKRSRWCARYTAARSC